MSGEVNVRLATADDAETISNILRDAFTVYREFYTPQAFAVVTPGADEILKRFDEGPQWIAEVDGKVVGTVSMITEPEGLYIRSMAVSPDAQGRGVGHKLMHAVDDFAVGTDIERVFLYTTYFVPGARDLYEKHGFEWVRDTTADEWYGTPGLEMDKRIEKVKRIVSGG